MSTEYTQPRFRANREIWQLRRLIRQTRRRIRYGYLDFEAGSKLLARHYNTLAYLLRVNSNIAPPWRSPSRAPDTLTTSLQQLFFQPHNRPPHPHAPTDDDDDDDPDD